MTDIEKDSKMLAVYASAALTGKLIAGEEWNARMVGDIFDLAELMVLEHQVRIAEWRKQDEERITKGS